LPTELPSGVVEMGARSYVPEVGRFLQPDPIPGGSANAYSYTFADPVNSSDPTGTSTLPPAWAIELGQTVANEGVAVRKAAEEAAARAEAEAAARAAAAAAAAAGGPSFAGEEGGEEEWWGEEEEEGYEEVSYHPEGKGPHFEDGVLYGALGEAGESETLLGRAAPLCAEHKTGNGGPSEILVRQPCVRNIDFLGIGKFAEGLWHKIEGGATHVWHSVSGWAHRHAAQIKRFLCNVSGWGSGILAGAGAGLVTENPFLVGAAGTAVGEGVKYACEH
jgi:hypothetical protein